MALSQKSLDYGQNVASNLTDNAGNIYQQKKYASSILERYGVPYQGLDDRAMIALGHAWDYETKNVNKALQQTPIANPQANQDTFFTSKFGAPPDANKAAMTSLAGASQSKPFWQGGTAGTGLSAQDLFAQGAISSLPTTTASAPSPAIGGAGATDQQLPTAEQNQAAYNFARGTTARPAYQGSSVVDYLKSVGQKTDFNSRSAMARGLGILNYTGTAKQNMQLLDALRKGGASGGTQAAPTGALPVASPATPGGAVTPSGTTTQPGNETAPGASVAPPGGTQPAPTATDPARAAMEAQIANLAAQPSSYDQYLKAYKDSGLSDADAKVKADQAKVNEIQTQISQIEENINKRIAQGGTMLTEEAAQRMAGAEEKPLLSKLDIYNRQLGVDTAAQGTAQSKLATLQGLSAADQTRTQEVLKAKTALAEYQSPQEKMAAEIAKYGEERKLALAETAPKYYPPTKQHPGITVYPDGRKVTDSGKPYTGQMPSSGGSNVTSSGTTNQKSARLDFWAQESFSGVSIRNLLPTTGTGKQAAAMKQELMDRIADNAIKLGIDGQTFGAIIADSKARQKTYTDLLGQGKFNQVNEDKAIRDFAMLDDLGKTMDKNSWKVAIPALQAWMRTGAVELTDNAAVNNYLGALTETLTTYAKVVSGQTTGAGVHQAANEATQQLIGRGLSTASVHSYIEKVAKPQMRNTVKSYDSALKGLFGDIKKIKSSDVTGGLDSGTDKQEKTIDLSKINFKV